MISNHENMLAHEQPQNNVLNYVTQSPIHASFRPIPDSPDVARSQSQSPIHASFRHIPDSPDVARS